MDKDTNKNLILALVLSLGVLIAWELFYGLPKMREQQAAQQAAEQATRLSRFWAAPLLPKPPPLTFRQARNAAVGKSGSG